MSTTGQIANAPAFAYLLKERNDFIPRPANFAELLNVVMKFVPEECFELHTAIAKYKLRLADYLAGIDEDDSKVRQEAAEIVDGLIDAIYFALGALLSLGQTNEVLQKCWDAVHASNLTKTVNCTEEKLCSKGTNFVRPNERIEQLIDLDKFIEALS